MSKQYKTILTLAMAIVLVVAMTACGNNDNNNSSSVSSGSAVPPAGNDSSNSASPNSPSSVAPDGVQDGGEYDATAQLYYNAISGARESDVNDAYGIFTHDRDYNMTTFRDNYTDMKKEDGSSYTDDEIGEFHDSAMDMQLSLLGLTADDVENYAISISPMNTRAYGIAIIKPAGGHEETVRQALEGFIQTQQQNFESYLPDQYEIAKNGYVKTLDDGTFVMVLTENQDTIYESIVNGLNATNGSSGASAGL